MKTILYKPNDFRNRCVACGLCPPDTKEHVYPKWLLKETKTWNYPINWISGKKNLGKNCVFPICESCNKAFNEELEKPFHRIFRKLKSGKAITDKEAETVIRWLWKLTQLFYVMSQKREQIAWSTNVRLKTTNPIEKPRYRVSVALALTKRKVENKDGVEPLGLDVLPQYNVLLSAGVFSNVSIITFDSRYKSLIPEEYTIHTLLPEPVNNNKVQIVIKRSFSDSYAAINTTIEVANRLLPLHERDSLDLVRALGINPFIADSNKIIY